MSRSLIAPILAPLTAMLFAAPASAATFEFFEGNNCTQKKLGGVNTMDHLQHGRDKITVLSRNIVNFAGIPVSSRQPWNDEARSVRITTDWRRQKEPRTSRVAIYDSPDARRDDDWAVIVVRDVMLIPPDGVCVGSFERRFDRDGVFLERHPQNGLDGKISFIISHCDAGCRANVARNPKAIIGRR